MSDSDAGQVAIVGMAVLLPGADSLDAFWRNIVTGCDAITDPPPGRWEPEFYDPQAKGPDRVYCRRGGFLTSAEFDPLQFGIVPSAVVETEVEQLIALKVAAAAIADAGGAERLPDPERVGVIVGRCGNSSVAQGRFFNRVRLPSTACDILRQLLPEVDEQRLELVASRIKESFGPFHPEDAIGVSPNLAASRVANRLGLGGPAYTIDAACASSLIAVSNALAELRSGQLDAALAGGVHHMHDVSFWSVFSQLGAMSRRGEIRPFDKAADGMLIGEATGMVLLKRLQDALRQGDRVYAVIRGVGTSSDGRSASLFNPDSRGQALALRRAWAAAGLDPTAHDALGMLEAHGTGTPTGDAAELSAIAEVFGPAHRGSQPVIGSVKSMVGHTIAAAGIVGMIKAALSVANGVLPPTLHCDDPHPLLEKTRFAPISSARLWPGPGPRRAAVNSFGFGGINAHVILEESPGVPLSGPGPGGNRPRAGLVVEPDQMILLSAPSPEAMSGLLAAGDDLLRDRSRQALAEAVGEPGHRCRLAIAEPKAQHIATARELAARGQAWRGGTDIWFSPKPLLADGAGQVAFVFPGLEGDFIPRLEYLTQPLGLTADDPALPISGGVAVIWMGLLLHDALQRLGIVPDALAGYSLGEWTAWAAGGIAERNALYQIAAQEPETPDVAVAVISAGCLDIEQRLPRYPGVVVSVDSAPDQSVLCGPADQVNRLAKELSAEGILCRPIPFRAGYHSDYYRSAAQTIAATADLRLRRGRVPVWSATLADLCPSDPAQLRGVFFRHLVQRVRFRETIRAMHKAGIRAFIQAGPGQLASVMHQSLRDLDHLAIAANVSYRDGISQLKRVAAALWVEGLATDLRVLNMGARASAKPPVPSRGQPVSLVLDSPRVSLGADAAGLLGRSSADGMTSSRIPPAIALLRAAGLPGAAEFAALIEDTAVITASVLSAAAAPATVRSTPLPGSRHPGASRDACPGTRRVSLRVCLDSMPYLKDHCLFTQPANWPHMADRWPVVPAMTQIQHIIDAVDNAIPELKVVKVTDARFNRWVHAEPAQDVEVTIEPAGAGAFTVRYGSYTKALVHMGAAYPQPQAGWHFDTSLEKPPKATAAWFSENSSFLGPSYRGITEILGNGEMHARANMRVTASPGAALDNGLQLAGQWLYSTEARRQLAIPVGFDSISFWGPTPSTGTMMKVLLLINSIDDAEMHCDIQFASDGQVWAQVENCVIRLFEGSAVLTVPTRHFFAACQPEGWVAVLDTWTDAVTPMLIAHKALGNSGYAEYERQPPLDRKQWLLGRLAAKDAVRLQLHREGIQDAFPIEIGITDGPGGRPRVHGWAGRYIPGYHVSVAYADKVAVALARAISADEHEDGPGVGISILPTDLATNGAGQQALSADERSILELITANSGDQEDLWLARFLACKNAAASASRPGGDQAACTIVSAKPGNISIQAAGQRYEVGYRESDEPGAPQYVIGWTWGPGRTPDYQSGDETTWRRQP